jgi:streptogramin lyase
MKPRVLIGFLVLFMAVSIARAQIVPSVTVQLRDARSLSVSADGRIYVADTGHHRVIVMDSTGQLLVETGGFGTEHGQFQWPRKVIANRGAAVWVLDYGNRRIEKFSRTLEYQGTLLIPGDENSRPRQIEEFALSPQGDVFVYDRDDGRLVRYDPLFRIEAELGQSRGSEYISALTRMVFVRDIGLIWWERGAENLRIADPLLTQVGTLTLGTHFDRSLVLSVADSCLLFGTTLRLEEWCDAGIPPDTLDILAAIQSELKRLDDIAVSSNRRAYVLDGLAGAVYLVSLPER